MEVIMTTNTLPVAVIGAGPVGLAAAAHLLSRGETPVVLEAGPTVGASIREWGHVRLFSPWQYVIDPISRSMLEATGWTTPPGDTLPTGNDLVGRYLLPLAQLPQLAPHIRLGVRVFAVTRQGVDKLKTNGREDSPIVLRVQRSDGTAEDILASAVIDASGTWTTPNPLGAGGVMAAGETCVAEHIAYGIPDLLGLARDRYAGRRVLVVGSGHSAFNALLDLADLAAEHPGTTVTWAIRRGAARDLYGGGEADALPATPTPRRLGRAHTRHRLPHRRAALDRWRHHRRRRRRPDIGNRRDHRRHRLPPEPLPHARAASGARSRRREPDRARATD
jgi:cation diffusion facilitator CzcD-associated flavoprotein CzcO